MTCIAVVNLKGGAGKTTLSIHLARGLELNGHSVAILDTDPQRSALDWHSASDGTATEVIEGRGNSLELRNQADSLNSSFGVLVIDGAPHAAALTRVAIEAADLVLIPVTPSPLDIWATHEIVTMVKQERRRRRALKAAFVVWRAIPRTKILEAAVEALAGMKLPTLPTQIHQRVSYAAAMIEGKTVLDTARTSPAAEEVRALIKDIEDI